MGQRNDRFENPVSPAQAASPAAERSSASGTLYWSSRAVARHPRPAHGQTSGHTAPVRTGSRNVHHCFCARGSEPTGSATCSLTPMSRCKCADPHFSGIAETCVEAGRIADFLELRLRRHPRMVGGIMRLRGVPRHPDRSQLEEYASNLAMVTIAPSAPPGLAEPSSPDRNRNPGSLSDRLA